MIYARLIGIDVYQNGTQLHGCKRDVDNLTNFLTGLGPQITVHPPICDSAATRATLYKTLRTDVASLKEGEQLIIHFSGHGVTIDDQGSARAAACPFNFQEAVPATGILESDLDEIMKDLKSGRRVTIFADCCFSGGLQKNFLLRIGANIWNGLQMMATKVGLKASSRVRIRSFSPAKEVQNAGTQQMLIDDKGRDVVLLAANVGLSGEHDFGNGSEGVFTHFLIQHLDSSNISEPATTTRDRVNDLTGEGQRFSQRAELHGNHNSFGKPLIEIQPATQPPAQSPRQPAVT
jgi:hypothetical protein